MEQQERESKGKEWNGLKYLVMFRSVAKVERMNLW